jgi:hypothetical protein
MTGHATRDLHLVNIENLDRVRVTEIRCAAFSAAYHSSGSLGQLTL